MKHLIIAVALAALPVTAAAQAVESSVPAPVDAPAPAAQARSEAVDSEQVCKLVREIGSNRAKRVCRSRAQIEADREAGRRELERSQR